MDRTFSSLKQVIAFLLLGNFIACVIVLPTSAEPLAAPAASMPPANVANHALETTPEPALTLSKPPPVSLARPSIVPEAVSLTEDTGLAESGASVAGEDFSALVNSVLSASVVKVRDYPIALETVLTLVQAQNLPIQQDRLTARIQNTAFWRSASNLLPDLTPTYTQSRFQGAIQIFGSATLTVFQTRLVPQLQGTWVIKPGGEDVFQALAARRRYDESRLRLDSTLQEQLALAAREYYDLLEAQVQVENVQVGLTEARSQVALSDARWKAGVGTKLDLMRSQTQLTQKQTDLVIAENRVAQAEQVLLNRLNLDPDIALTTDAMTVQPRVLVPLFLKTNALVSRALLNNPSLLAEAQELKAISAESKATLSRVVPTVTLQTYINGTGPEIDKLGLGRFGGLAIQSNLLEHLGTSIPLDYHAKRLTYQRQQIQWQQRVRDIQTQVLSAFLDSRAAAQAMLTAQDELSTAREAYRLALGRYKAGLGINVDVLNAQTALTLARTRITQAILSFNRAQVSLVEALGEASPVSLLNGVKSSPPSQSAGKKSTP
jgi:outer membrane protein